jgi:hypothetical protein
MDSVPIGVDRHPFLPQIPRPEAHQEMPETLAESGNVESPFGSRTQGPGLDGRTGGDQEGDQEGGDKSTAQSVMRRHEKLLRGRISERGGMPAEPIP